MPTGPLRVMDCTNTFFTTTLHVACIPPIIAVTVMVPGAIAVTSPALPGSLDTDATVASDDSHATSVVRSCVLPSEKVPVTASCCDSPAGSATDAGVTAIDCSVKAV